MFVSPAKHCLTFALTVKINLLVPLVNRSTISMRVCAYLVLPCLKAVRLAVLTLVKLVRKATT